MDSVGGLRFSLSFYILRVPVWRVVLFVFSVLLWAPFCGSVCCRMVASDVLLGRDGSLDSKPLIYFSVGYGL